MKAIIADPSRVPSGGDGGLVAPPCVPAFMKLGARRALEPHRQRESPRAASLRRSRARPARAAPHTGGRRRAPGPPTPSCAVGRGAGGAAENRPRPRRSDEHHVRKGSEIATVVGPCFLHSRGFRGCWRSQLTRRHDHERRADRRSRPDRSTGSDMNVGVSRLMNPAPASRNGIAIRKLCNSRPPLADSVRTSRSASPRAHDG